MRTASRSLGSIFVCLFAGSLAAGCGGAGDSSSSTGAGAEAIGFRSIPIDQRIAIDLPPDFDPGLLSAKGITVSRPRGGPGIQLDIAKPIPVASDFIVGDGVTFSPKLQGMLQLSNATVHVKGSYALGEVSHIGILGATEIHVDGAWKAQAGIDVRVDASTEWTFSEPQTFPIASIPLPPLPIGGGGATLQPEVDLALTCFLKGSASVDAKASISANGNLSIDAAFDPHAPIGSRLTNNLADSDALSTKSPPTPSFDIVEANDVELTASCTLEPTVSVKIGATLAKLDVGISASAGPYIDATGTIASAGGTGEATADWKMSVKAGFRGNVKIFAELGFLKPSDTFPLPEQTFFAWQADPSTQTPPAK